VIQKKFRYSITKSCENWFFVEKYSMLFTQSITYQQNDKTKIKQKKNIKDTPGSDFSQVLPWSVKWRSEKELTLSNLLRSGSHPV
jgi:hypothetical protein